MARATANKLYNVFVKGLITEASALTYPENATIAEDNCTLSRKGNRARRLGIDMEFEGALTSIGTNIEGFDAQAISEFTWESVANRAGLDYLVMQVGLSLFLFQLVEGESVSSGAAGLNLNLEPFVRADVDAPESQLVSMASGKGNLFVVGPHLEPIIIEYNRDTNTLLASRVYLQIRDFQGVDDALANDQEPTTLTPAHHYNLRNQGWVSPNNDNSGNLVTYYTSFGSTGTYNAPTSGPITTYFTSQSRYPPNSKQWFSGKTADGTFDPALLAKFFSGSARAPRGHFITDAFNIDRSAVSGVTGIPVETNYERPNTVSFFAGRVWYATNSTVYYSQVLDDKRKAGFCYQEADPTSEDISDLIATDGGVIPIPEMAKSVRLVPAGAGILVFATNGIWSITGTSSGFTATDISVSKVSPIGTESPNSIIEAEGQFYWWSKIGIMGMTQNVGIYGPIEGSYNRTNISEQTIQALYNDINSVGKQRVKGVFDPAHNLVQWLYTSDPSRPHRYDKVLNLDLTLQAFYPWTISSDETTGWVTGAFTTSTLNDLNLEFGGSPAATFVKFTSVWPLGTSYQVAFANFRNTRFQDWGVTRYMSFIETGYELLDDAMRPKQITYVVPYFKPTEERFIKLESDDGYTMSHQSSCHFQVRWDWSDSAVSARWSNKVQAYRLPSMPVVDENDLTVNTGYAIVSSKQAVNGSGRAIQFRFECDEIDRDFDLLGWSAAYSGNVSV